MHLVSLTDLNDYCRRALGRINKIYLHWTAGRYNQQFDDYHINIDRDGNIYIDGELTDHKNHLYAQWFCSRYCFRLCLWGSMD